jgi:putative ABC transport system permease protein
VQALNETVHEPSRFGLVSFLLGVIFSAGAAAVLAFTPMQGGVGVGMSFIGCSLLLIATALLGPLLVRTVGRFVSGIVQLLGGVTGTMAAANIRSQSSNVASAFVPLTLLLALNGTMLLTSTLLNEQTAEQHQQRIAAADHVLSLQGESSRFSTELIKQVEQLQGVSSVTSVRPTRIKVYEEEDEENYTAQGLTTIGTSHVLDLSLEEGDLLNLESDGIAISVDLANQQGWTIGDVVEFELADSTRFQGKIKGIYNRSLGFGDVIVPEQLIIRHDPSSTLVNAYIAYESGEDAARAERELQQIAKQWIDLSVLTPQESEQFFDEELATQKAALYMMLSISALFMAIAVINTFAIATSARISELRDLWLAGATPAQLHRILAWETFVIITLGLLMGSVITGIVVGKFSLSQDGVLRLIVDPYLFGALVTGAVLLGWFVSVVPARLTVKAACQFISTTKV